MPSPTFAQVAIILSLIGMCAAAEQPSQTKGGEDSPLVTELVEALQSYIRTDGRQGRQLSSLIAEAFSSDSDLILNLGLRLVQTALSGVQTMITNTLSTRNVRQYSDVWIELLWFLVRAAGQGAVSYIRAYNYQLADIMENFLAELEVISHQNDGIQDSRAEEIS